MARKFTYIYVLLCTHDLIIRASLSNEKIWIFMV